MLPRRLTLASGHDDWWRGRTHHVASADCPSRAGADCRPGFWANNLFHFPIVLQGVVHCCLSRGYIHRHARMVKGWVAWREIAVVSDHLVIYLISLTYLTMVLQRKWAYSQIECNFTLDVSFIRYRVGQWIQSWPLLGAAWSAAHTVRYDLTINEKETLFLCRLLTKLVNAICLFLNIIVTVASFSWKCFTCHF